MSTFADRRPWTDDVVTRYLTATAQQKDDPKTFYDTHLDIDTIYAEFLPRYQDTFVDQETFRDELTDAPIDADIRTFIVRGETGSGKSQLCQWLDYELAGKGTSSGAPERIPLHIKANQTNLEHIIQTLAEPLGEDPEIRQVTSLEADKVANAIISNLTANPGQKLEDAGVDRIVQEGGLKAILESNIERYQRGLEESDETEFDPNLITKEDYRDIALKLGTGSVFHTNSDILRQALRDEIHRHFSHVIGVDDFQGQLRDYAQRYVNELGKRPVIICEDVTTFSVLKEQLLDQIIQVESAAYDIVLGYTTGFEQNDLQDALGNRGDQDALTYLKDRAEGYLSLTQDGNAYFLDDAISVELVRKYMDVIKRESEADIDADTEAAFDDLYPFNRAFVQLAYNNLLEEGSPRRTPRVLLQKVVRRVLLSDDAPYEVAEKSPNIDSVVSPIDPASYDNELQQLATWYGYRDETEDDSDRVLVHPIVLDLYGFGDEGEGTVEYEDVEYVWFYPDESAVRLLGDANERPAIPSKSPSETEAESGPSTDDEGETDTGTGTSTSGTTTTGTEPGGSGGDEGTDGRRQQQYKELVEWAETGDSYPSSDVLRGGAESVLEMWYDPTRLGNPNASTTGTQGIYYTRGDDIPVSVEGPDERTGLSVMLSFGKENLGLYRQLFEVGTNEGEIPDSATVEQLRSWAMDSVVGFRNDMREQIESCLPAGMRIEHTILLARFLLTNAEFGGTECSPEVVFDRREPASDRQYASPIVEAFRGDAGIREALNSLKMRRNDINGLVDGFFLLKKNFVDYQRLAPARSDIASDPMEYIELAQQIDTERLDYPSAYNIGTSRSNANVALTSFLNTLSDYAVELELLNDDELEEHFQESVEPVETWYDPDHTVDELGEILGTLLDCLGTFGETKSERWEELHDDMAAADPSIRLGPFGDRIDAFIEPDTTSPIERIRLLHEFQQSKEEDRAWEIYEVLDEIIDTLDKYDIDENDDLEDRVRNLQEVSTYEATRSDVIDAINTY